LNRIAQIQQEQTRRALLLTLYDHGGAIHAQTVRVVIDGLNYSTTWENFLAHIEYLAGEELLAAFPAGCIKEMQEMEQAKYLTLVRQSSFDSEEARSLCLRIRQRGRRFIEGNEPDVRGVSKS